MRKNTLVLAAVLLSVGLAAPAAAIDEPENVIKYRQAVMKSMGAHAAAIVKVVKGEVSFVGHVAAHARGINEMSKLIPDIFPMGTGNDAFADTRALPDIWKDRAKFDAAAKMLQSESAKLVEVAADRDVGAIGAQLENVGKACGGCHKPFRAEKK
jgi:cytochrome c556